jgi:hypothetical protein
MAGPAARGAVPDLVRSLNDTEISIRRLAVEVLGGIGPAASVAIPELKKLGQGDPESRELVLKMLQQIERLDDRPRPRAGDAREARDARQLHHPLKPGNSQGEGSGMLVFHTI